MYELRIFLIACVQLECRLNSCEARWEAVRTIFYGNSVIPIYGSLDAEIGLNINLLDIGGKLARKVQLSTLPIVQKSEVKK